ncbi:hypothetical protein [Tomitella gaofuii]|uniref:hypothetical protein n=1 Tax=Tomitella gaofuii TaxID=2760083 RepID=UPI0015FB582B|nr:hypothetical protein [Tomitella gaofuii]
MFAVAASIAWTNYRVGRAEDRCKRLAWEVNNRALRQWLQNNDKAEEVRRDTHKAVKLAASACDAQHDACRADIDRILDHMTKPEVQ